MTARRRWVDDTLFYDPAHSDDPVLAGSTCAACETTTFPAQAGCPRCGGDEMTRVALPTRGTLWSFTVQYFAPKLPFRTFEPFEPFGVGYVNLGSVCVESRLTVNDPAQMKLGMPMRLVVVPAFEDVDGIRIDTFGFSPDQPEGAA